MSIIERLAQSKSIELDVEEKASSLGELFDDSNASYSKDILPKMKATEYLKSATGWVYGCVNAISRGSAMINLHLYKQKGNETEEIFDHPILDVLYRPNGFMTKFDLMKLSTQYLELTGESPWFISYQNGVPSQIVLLRPDMLSLKKGDAENIINGYKYKVGNKEIDLDIDEVVFLRDPDPNTPFRGSGTLQAVARTYDIDNSAELYNAKFFSNSARPDTVLSTDKKLTQEQVADLEKRLKRKFGGTENAHKTLILQGGLKASPLNMSAKDMDFVEQQRFSRDKILAIFQVPRSILGITEDVNRANAEASEYTFAKYTIKPKMEQIIEQLNEFFVPLFPNSDNLFLNFDDPVPDNVDLKLRSYESGLNNGYMTINEVRAREGLLDIGEVGDTPRIQSTLVPVSNDPLGLGVEPAPVKEIGVRKAQLNARTSGKRREEKRKQIFSNLVQKEVEKLLTKRTKQLGMDKFKYKVKHNKKQTEIPAEELVLLDFQAKQLRISDDYEPTFKAKVMKWFKSQARKTLDKFPAKGIKALDPKDFYLNADDEADAYASLTKNLSLEIILKQGEEAYNFIGIDAKLSASEAISAFIKLRTGKIAEDMTKETNALIKARLSDGVKLEESIPELKKRIRSLFNEMAPVRSERIARTEVLKASNFASHQAYKESGVVTRKRWLTALDERTCEFCGPMNGKIVGLDENYFDKGDNANGYAVDYEDVEDPPLHPNCRCTIIPVIQRAISDSEAETKEPTKEPEKKEVTPMISDDVSVDDLIESLLEENKD